jgi:hypothetical protein
MLQKTERWLLRERGIAGFSGREARQAAYRRQAIVVTPGLDQASRPADMRPGSDRS